LCLLEGVTPGRKMNRSHWQASTSRRRAARHRAADQAPGALTDDVRLTDNTARSRAEPHGLAVVLLPSSQTCAVQLTSSTIGDSSGAAGARFGAECLEGLRRGGVLDGDAPPHPEHTVLLRACNRASFFASLLPFFALSASKRRLSSSRALSVAWILALRSASGASIDGAVAAVGAGCSIVCPTAIVFVRAYTPSAAAAEWKRMGSLEGCVPLDVARRSRAATCPEAARCCRVMADPNRHPLPAYQGRSG
jgi:hypothetical protein